MSTHLYTGGCHCANISVKMELMGVPEAYHPRACDCGYCVRHGASYLSDPDGKLSIQVADAAGLGRYRQGDMRAEFIFCRMCGVLVGVSYEEGGHRYGAINSRVITNAAVFGESLIASPRKLTQLEKIQRWKEIWFQEFDIKVANV